MKMYDSIKKYLAPVLVAGALALGNNLHGEENGLIIKQSLKYTQESLDKRLNGLSKHLNESISYGEGVLQKEAQYLFCNDFEEIKDKLERDKTNLKIPMEYNELYRLMSKNAYGFDFVKAELEKKLQNEGKNVIVEKITSPNERSTILSILGTGVIVSLFLSFFQKNR